jgi:DNA-binding NtrC family response regulator
MKEFDPSQFTILVVDDEVDLCDLFAEELEECGFKVFTAYGGDQAYEIVKNNEVNGILSDIKMPDGDGLNLLSNVRKEFGEILVMVMMTGYADISESELIDLGAKGLYHKPIDIDDFISDLKKILMQNAVA